jgi:hypothetical protein
MKQVGRRGCTRSACELSKLILGMDPQGDPMNVLLCIDYYALTSRQCHFIIDLFATQQGAVDRFEKNKIPLNGTICDLPNMQFSFALAKYFLNQKEEAKEILCQAILRFPTLLKPLLEKCSVNINSSSLWQNIFSDRVFANAKKINTESTLQHLLDIYVTRNYTLWKVNEVQSFLLQSVQYAIGSSVLVSTYPQVMDLPPTLQKYKRAISSGK